MKSLSFYANDKQSVGVLGAVLCGSFCLSCVIQGYRLHIQARKRPSKLQVLFLIISFMAALFDGLYFAMMIIYLKYTILGYIFHMMAMFCFAMAFIVVVFRWNKVLKLAGSSSLEGATYLLIAGNVVVTLTAIIESWSIYDYEKYINHWSYEAVAISNCSTIFIYSVGVFFCARYVKAKLMVSSITTINNGYVNDRDNSIFIPMSLESQQGRDQLIKKLLKMNIVLGLCSLCYFLRVVCLTFVLMDVERDETTTDSIAIIWWFTLSLWIPSLGSGSLLLYTMRPLRPVEEETVRGGRWPRYTALSSDPSCNSSSTGSRLHSSHKSRESTDADTTYGYNSSNEYDQFDIDLGDDNGDIAFKYEAATHKERYRNESLSTGTLEHDFSETS